MGPYWIAKTWLEITTKATMPTMPLAEGFMHRTVPHPSYGIAWGMEKKAIPTAILSVELIVAVALIAVALLGGRDSLADAACWAGGALLATLALISLPRKYPWLDVAVGILALLVWWWGVTPDPGANIGKGFLLVFFPWVMTGLLGAAIGAGISALYKLGEIVASGRPAER